jgi:hypothetical protein
MVKDEESPRIIKDAITEVKGVVGEVKEGLLDTMDETREVVQVARVRPIRRRLAKRFLGEPER